MARFCSSLLIPLPGKNFGQYPGLNCSKSGYQQAVYTSSSTSETIPALSVRQYTPQETTDYDGILNAGVAATEAICSPDFIALLGQRSQQFGFGDAGRKRGTDALAINVFPVRQPMPKKACRDASNNRWAAKPPQSLQSSCDDRHKQHEHRRSCGALTRHATQGVKTGPGYPLLHHA